MNKLSEILQVRERLVELINYHDHEYAFDLYAGHIKLLFGTTPMLTQSYVSLVSQNLNQSKMALANIKESLTQEVEKIDILIFTGNEKIDKLGIYNLSYLEKHNQLFLKG